MSDQPKSLTSGLERGKESAALLALQKRGISVQQYTAIGHHQGVADKVATALNNALFFSSPAEQIDAILGFNEDLWKNKDVTEQAIWALGDPPEVPISDESSLYCLILCYWDYSPVDNFRQNWQACRKVLGDQQSDAPGVGANYSWRARPRLEWLIVELGRRHSDVSPKHVHNTYDSSLLWALGEELPLIAALHPRWAAWTDIDQDSVPRLCAPRLFVFNEALKENREPSVPALLTGGQNPVMGSMGYKSCFGTAGVFYRSGLVHKPKYFKQIR